MCNLLCRETRDTVRTDESRVTDLALKFINNINHPSSIEII